MTVYQQARNKKARVYQSSHSMSIGSGIITIVINPVTMTQAMSRRRLILMIYQLISEILVYAQFVKEAFYQ